MTDPLSYRSAGVDIENADRTKAEMAASLRSTDARVLNTLGAFASLFDARFPGYREPVLVLKMEEPGSKQKLAFRYGRVPSICRDLVNHLVNDIAVMGARPLAVQDVIVCGRLERETVSAVVRHLAEACRDLGCTLVGGETSEQPGVLEAGTYVLAASVVGVAERSAIVDGSSIRAGDAVLAVASNGLHTNGYSLVRALIDRAPSILERGVGGESFLDAIMRPHTPYLRPLEGLFGDPALHGMAHITGGGIEGNFKRVLPRGVDAVVDLPAVRVPPVFQLIREAGAVDEADMLRTFNVGAGLVLAVDAAAAGRVAAHIGSFGIDCYPIGEVVAGSGQVRFRGELKRRS
jgi:phosphoribosylformylglycinamidine cyclo-ligase